MMILCAIGMRNCPDLIRRAAGLVAAGQEWAILHVTDTGPRHKLEPTSGTACGVADLSKDAPAT